MKYCKQCKITTKSNRLNCPLCQSVLKDQTGETYETFPDIEINYKKHNLIIKILMLISAAISLVCLTINIYIPTDSFWGFYVIIGILFMWINLINTLKRQKNIVKNINTHIIIISIFAIIWDIITGWNGWSIEYVFPIVCLNSVISISVVAKILKYSATDYLIYLFFNIIFGLIPILFLSFNLVDIRYPSISCILGSILAFLWLLTFEFKNIKEELKRRLHI